MPILFALCIAMCLQAKGIYIYKDLRDILPNTLTQVAAYIIRRIGKHMSLREISLKKTVTLNSIFKFHTTTEHKNLKAC